MLSYSLHGQIKDPPLLFLHGFLGSKEDWDEMISNLKSHYFCISVDLPGHGASPLVENFEKALILLLVSLGIKECALVGYSMGGRLSLQLKEKHPNLFTALAILSSHTGIHDEEERKKRWEEDLKWHKLLETLSLGEFIKRWYDQPIFSSFKNKKELFCKILEKRNSQNTTHLQQALIRYSVAKQLPTSSFEKTLFLYGEEDLKYAALYRTLPPLTLVKEIKDAGHVLHLENPKDCSLAIQQFLIEVIK